MVNFEIMNALRTGWSREGFCGKDSSSTQRKSKLETKGKKIVLTGIEYEHSPLQILAGLRTKLLQSVAENAEIIIPKESAIVVSIQQIKTALETIGLEVQDVRVLSQGSTCFTVCCTYEKYNDFLSKHKLPAYDIKHLIVTTEHSDYRVTGGIGSYVKECETLYGGNAGICMIDTGTKPNYEYMQGRHWLYPQRFMSHDRVESILYANFDTLGDLAAEVIESITVLYPELETIESQEMLLNRAIEAKKLGFIPGTIKLITVCHGSSFHLAKAKRAVLEAENIHVAYREKFTLEESDCVIFPTNFLRESYRDSGVKNLDDPSRVIKRLPFDTSRLPRGDGGAKKFKRLVYIGKTSTIKGFDLFLESVLALKEQEPKTAQEVEEIVIMATSTAIEEPYLRELFLKVEATFSTKMVSLQREDLLRTLVEYSSDSLALVTYRGDNHPLAVLELMAVGHDFIAANAAGTPELIQSKYKKHSLAEPDPVSFVAKIKGALEDSVSRKKITQNVAADYLLQQKSINESYNNEYLHNLPKLLLKTITVPTNIDAYIIKDGKAAKQVRKTKSSLQRQTQQGIRIHEVESGDNLPEAKENKLSIRVYAGDILTSRCIEQMVMLMQTDHNCRAVFCYENTPTYEGGQYVTTKEFHPSAPQLGSFFLQEKFSRRVIGIFRGKILGSEYTDWHRGIDVVSQKGTVRVVPRMNLELAQISNYPDQDLLRSVSRFSHAFSALPVFDAMVLLSELKRFDDLYWGTQLTNHLDAMYIRRDDPSITYHAPRALIQVYRHSARLLPTKMRRGIYLGLRGAYRAARKISRR